MRSGEEIIAALNLEPLPGEGGYFRETWRSGVPGQSPVGSSVEDRSAGTAIYYLVTEASFSVLHRLPIDEVWHFYLGDPVEQLRLDAEEGSGLVVLGPSIGQGQEFQSVVRAGVWQGTRLQEGGSFALMGTTMAPGFDFRDYESGESSVLAAQFPEWTMEISRFVRS
ncbi:MAG: cupin domain-containing protein [Verrucomicrobiota bacterium]